MAEREREIPKWRREERIRGGDAACTLCCLVPHPQQLLCFLLNLRTGVSGVPRALRTQPQAQLYQYQILGLFPYTILEELPRGVVLPPSRPCLHCPF